MRAWIVVIGLLAGGLCWAADNAETIIWGGPIYTGNERQPRAEAVAIGGGKILYVGDRKGAQALVGPSSQIVELQGAALFPGFTDSHVHLDGVGYRELTLNLEGAVSISEVVARLKTKIAAAKPGEVIFGRGWIETGWPEKRFLNRGDLDPVSGDHPVLLERADGHAVVANSAALDRAKIGDSTADPAGGTLIRDQAGHVTGMLVDNAMALVDSVMPAETDESRDRALKIGMAVENRYGWTGVHFMSAPWDDVLALEKLAEKGEAPLRVYAAVDREDAGKLFASGPRSAADQRVVTRAIKLYEDGALGSRGAALFADYSDQPGNRGLVRTPDDQMRPVMIEAAQRGLQICTHAIGDRGNANVLDLYAAALPAAGKDPRWRIEHAQHIRPADIPRFAALGVIASMQPSHAIGDLHFAPARLGLERLKGAYAWNSLLQSGATVIGGSDAPVERGDPLIEFYAVVARKDLGGYSGEGWHQEEALSRQEALKIFTSKPAFARFAETELGTIEIGKRADLTAFSVDLMQAPEAEIPKGHATLTMVDGKIVYRQ